ncbi:TIGR04104 family putative zinc finger protein [Salimicrobium jeotgali]|uniref:TIGR04104 family putative zinc finger protein n=1 Tax=Salimicrobium jeotgali TaxID=1230341 RepID=UPI002154FEC7|nr:TIGR04104 family putative zinc finger protein [Salimicrobium jeotgali]
MSEVTVRSDTSQKGGEKMPTCENCHNKWKWKETIKKTSTIGPGMTCPYCKKTQYQTKSSIRKINTFMPIVLLPLLLQIFFDIPGAVLLSLFPVLLVVFIIFYPFLVEVSSRKTYAVQGKR